MQGKVPNGWPGVAYTRFPPPRFRPDSIRNIIVGNKAVTPEPDSGRMSFFFFSLLCSWKGGERNKCRDRERQKNVRRIAETRRTKELIIVAAAKRNGSVVIDAEGHDPRCKEDLDGLALL